MALFGKPPTEPEVKTYSFMPSGPAASTGTTVSATMPIRIPVNTAARCIVLSLCTYDKWAHYRETIIGLSSRYRLILFRLLVGSLQRSAASRFVLDDTCRVTNKVAPWLSVDACASLPLSLVDSGPGRLTPEQRLCHRARQELEAVE